MITLFFLKADLWRHSNSWIHSCLLSGLVVCASLVPVSFSQFYLSLDMSLVCDAPADILFIHANEAFVIAKSNFWICFVNPQPWSSNCGWNFLCYLFNNYLRMKNKLWYCNTVYWVFILFTVSAQGHRNHFNLQNVFTYLFIICLCIQRHPDWNHH